MLMNSRDGLYNHPGEPTEVATSILSPKVMLIVGLMLRREFICRVSQLCFKVNSHLVTYPVTDG